MCALVVTELSTKFTAQTDEFQQGIQTVKSGLSDAEQKAKETAAAADAAWKQMAATAGAQAGIQNLGARVDKLVGQASTLSPALQRELGSLQSTLNNLAGKPYSLELRANVAQARAELATIQRQATIEVQANTAPAISALERLRSVAGGVMDVLGKFGLASMGIQMVTSAVQGAASALGIDFNAGMERAQTAFTGLLGSADKATAYLQELWDFAAHTPFEFQGVKEAAQFFMGMGIDGRAVIPILTDVGNAMAKIGGTDEQMRRVEVALAQMIAKNKVSAQEMNQLAENGVAGWQILATFLHKSVKDVMKDAEDGKISAATFMQAFHQANVGDAMAAQSRTFSGAISTIRDNIQGAIGTAFKPLFNVVSEGAQRMADFLSSAQFQQWAQQVAGAVQGAIGALGQVAGVLGQVVQAAKGGNPVLLGIAAAITAAVVPAFVGWAASATAAAAATLAALAPVVVPLAAIGAAVAALKVAWDNDFGGIREIVGHLAIEVQALFATIKGAWDTLTAAFKDNGLEGVFDNLPKALVPVAQALSDMGTTIREAVGTWAHDLAQWALDAIPGLMDNLGELLGNAVGWVVNDAAPALLSAVGSLASAIVSWIQPAAQDTPTLLDNVGTAISGWVGGVAPQVMNWFANVGQRMIAGIARGINNMAPDLLKGLQDMLNNIINGINSVFHSDLKPIDFQQIIHLDDSIKQMEQFQAKHKAVVNQATQDMHAASSEYQAAYGKQGQAAIKAAADQLGASQQVQQTQQQQFSFTQADYQKYLNDLAKNADLEDKTHKKRAKSAADAAREIAASQEQIIGTLGRAAQESGSQAKGIGQAMVTLLALLKEKIPPDMAFVKDAIVGELKQAASDSPPTVQELHDKVVSILQQLRTKGSTEVKLMVAAQLEALDDFQAKAAASADKAAAKIDAALVKAHQSAVENLGKLGELLTDPKANVGDVTVAMLDAQKAAVDAKLPALASTYQQYLDQISSGANINLAQVRQTVVSQLQAMQTGSDPVMAAWAGAMIAKMDEVAQKAQADAQQVFEAQAQQREALLQTQRSLADSLGTVGSDVISGVGDPAAVVDMIKLVQDAGKTGAMDLAGTFTQMIATVNNGGKLLTEQTLNTVRAFLQELSQSADAETAMMARKVLANLDKMQADATRQAQQAAQQAQASMEQAGQGMVQGLARAAQDMQTPGKTLTDVLVDMIPLMQQATAAGMPQVAATIQQYLDQARLGGVISIQGLHDSLIRMLQDAQASGNQSVALFAQQAIEQLNQVTQQANATASLQAYQQAQEAAQAAAQQASEAYQRQQKVLQDLQKQLQDAQKAQQDFTNAPLQGEHAANEAQFQNQQQQNQLQLQITRLQFEGAPRAQIEALQHQLDTVRQQGEMLRLQTSTTFDPLHHAIQEAVDDTKELTYQDAINGAIAQKNAVAELQQKIADQTRVVDQAQAAQQRAQAAAQAASQAYQEQQRALQQLQQTQQQSLLQMAQMAQQMQAAGVQAQTTGTQVQAGMTQAATGVGQLNTAVATGVGQVLPAYQAMFAPTNDGMIFHMLFDHSEGFFTKVDEAITRAMDYTRLEVWTAQFTMLKQLVTDQLGKIRGEAQSGGRNVGNALGEGIKQGIGDEVSAIAQEAAAAVRAAIDAARDEADAHSPSEKSRAIVGKPIGQGIARGIRDTAAESAAAARQTVQGALAAGAAAVGAGAGVGGAGGVGGPITVNNYLTAQLSMADLTNPAFWDGAIGRAISIALQRRGAMRQPNGAPA